MSASMLAFLWERISHRRLGYSVVDEKIKHLVDTMNATRVVKTIASCQGHAWPPASVPYIYFKASPTVATHLQRALDRARTNGKLNNTWVLEGIFCHGNLQFLLVAPRLRKCSVSVIRSLVEFQLFRQELDADIAALVLLVKQFKQG